MMTIPSRPAPPPPSGNKTSVTRSASNLQRNYLQQSTSAGGTKTTTTSLAWGVTSSSASTRYTPATNWDDQPFNDGQIKQINKKPPPRPPPPKVKPETIKKSASPQSINILSNLFSKKSQPQQQQQRPPPPTQSSALINKFQINNNKNVKRGTSFNAGGTIPPKLPAPPSSLHQQPHHPQVDLMQLIDLSSPPSSPTLTQQSNSDCVSVDSFSSDSNYYYSAAPLTNCGTNNINNPIINGSSSSVSQAESGFEDDFNCWSSSSNNSGATPSSLNDPFDLIENVVGATTDSRYDGNIRVVKTKGVCLPEKQSSGSSSLFYTKSSVGNNLQTPSNGVDFPNNLDHDDHLSNGKSLIPPTPMLAMPTIIRPASVQQNKSGSGNNSPAHLSLSKLHHSQEIILVNDDITIPMPTCPPPPPPPAEYLNNDYEYDDYNDESNDIDGDNDAEESYCIALYDFDGLQDGDLSFRENDKIYIIKAISDEWLFGRSKRGCEGVFPVSYVDIKIPIKINNYINNNNNNKNTTDNSNAIKEKIKNHHMNGPPPTTTTIKTTTAAVYKPIKVKALYNFMAEIIDDLSLRENDEVTLLHRINDEWLYGEIKGRFGQFPSNYIDYIPSNLPTV